jgi:3-phosphoshikimate 1-carboxyvinyltransferase
MSLKSFSLNINQKINPFIKTIKVDADKSLSIRSFIIASISENISTVKNILESEDVFSTIDCLRKLGVKIVRKNPGQYEIYGKGLVLSQGF